MSNLLTTVTPVKNHAYTILHYFPYYYCKQHFDNKMNASGVNKKRKRQLIAESEIEKVEDTELQAEIEAVLEMRAEKGNVEKTSKQPSAYNSAALLKSIEDMGTVNLPFIQTLRISDYTLGNIIDENDDLEREVTISLFSFHSSIFINTISCR